MNILVLMALGMLVFALALLGFAVYKIVKISRLQKTIRERKESKVYRNPDVADSDA